MTATSIPFRNPHANKNAPCASSPVTQASEAAPAADVVESKSILFKVRVLPREAFGDANGHRTRKQVLVMLATYADPDGKSCYPGISKLAKACCLSERTIHRALAGLKDCGLLKIAYKVSPTHGNLYTILIPDPVTNVTVSPMSQCHQCQSDPDTSDSQTLTPVTTYLPNTNQRPTNKRAPKNGAPFVVPDWVPVHEWKAFEEMRHKLRRPMTDHARELIVRELEKLRNAGDSPADVLNQSVRKSWQDVFPLNREHGSHRALTANPLDKMKFANVEQSR